MTTILYQVQYIAGTEKPWAVRCHAGFAWKIIQRHETSAEAHDALLKLR